MISIYCSECTESYNYTTTVLFSWVYMDYFIILSTIDKREVKVYRLICTDLNCFIPHCLEWNVIVLQSIISCWPLLSMHFVSSVWLKRHMFCVKPIIQLTRYSLLYKTTTKTDIFFQKVLWHCVVVCSCYYSNDNWRPGDNWSLW